MLFPFISGVKLLCFLGIVKAKGGSSMEEEAMPISL